MAEGAAFESSLVTFLLNSAKTIAEEGGLAYSGIESVEFTRKLLSATNLPLVELNY